VAALVAFLIVPLTKQFSGVRVSSKSTLRCVKMEKGIKEMRKMQGR
jgi:hypothetical protein